MIRAACRSLFVGEFSENVATWEGAPLQRLPELRLSWRNDPVSEAYCSLTIKKLSLNASPKPLAWSVHANDPRDSSLLLNDIE